MILILFISLRLILFFCPKEVEIFSSSLSKCLGPQNLFTRLPGRDDLSLKDCKGNSCQLTAPSIKGHHLGLMLRTLWLGLIRIGWL